MPTNNNYCFTTPFNTTTPIDNSGIIDISDGSSGIFDDGSSTTNPNAPDPNTANGNESVSIFKEIFSVANQSINSTFIVVGNSNELSNVSNNINYSFFLVSGNFEINGITNDGINEAYYDITFSCYNGNNFLFFQDHKLYRIVGNQVKTYGFNFLLPNHNKVKITITNPSTNINQSTTLITKGYIRWNGLINDVDNLQQF